MNISVLIFFAIIGAAICTRARVAGGAVVFAVIAIVLFVNTPVGAGLPGAIGNFLSTLDHAAGPVLNGSRAAG